MLPGTKYTRSTTHRVERGGVVLVWQEETSIEFKLETKPAKAEAKNGEDG